MLNSNGNDGLDAQEQRLLNQLARIRNSSDDSSADFDSFSTLKRSQDEDTADLRDDAILELPCEWDSRYVLLEHLGGGMSHVYRAQQRSLDNRNAVVKVLRNVSPGSRARFARESRILSKLGQVNSRHFVTVLDHVDSSDATYITMEYVEGHSLKSLLADPETADLPLDIYSIAEIIRQAAVALSTAHEVGIIHRDIKPSNMMLDHTHVVRLIDFGVAAQDFTASVEQLTSTGVVPGTKGYMSPEQLAGIPLDGGTDIYSLGVVFQELLRQADARHGAQSFLTKRNRQQIELIARRMMERERKNRYATADEVAAALAPFAAKSRLQKLATLSSRASSARPGTSNRFVRAAVVVCAAGVLLMAFSFVKPQAFAVSQIMGGFGDSSLKDMKAWAESLGGGITRDSADRLVKIKLPNKRVEDEDLKRVADEPALVDINLQKSSVRGPGLDYLQQKLDRLILTGSMVEDQGLQILEGRTIQHLGLGGVKGITDDGLESLGKIKELRRLSLSDTVISDDGLDVLARVCPGIQDLELLGLDITAEGLKALRGLYSLKKLEISQIPLNDECVRMIATHPLEELWIANALVSDVGVEMLSNCASMKTLVLSVNQYVTDDSIPHLLKLEKLEHLDLRYTAVTEQGVAELAKLPRLRSLLLNGTKAQRAGNLSSLFPKGSVSKPSDVGRVGDLMATVMTRRSKAGDIREFLGVR